MTGLVTTVELLRNQPFPCSPAGTGRTRHTKHDRAIAHTCKRSGLNSRTADFSVRKITENFTKPINVHIQQWRDCLDGIVAGGKSGATGQQDGLYLIVSDQCGNQCTQFEGIIFDNDFFEQPVTGGL